MAAQGGARMVLRELPVGPAANLPGPGLPSPAQKTEARLRKQLTDKQKQLLETNERHFAELSRMCRPPPGPPPSPGRQAQQRDLRGGEAERARLATKCEQLERVAGSAQRELAEHIELVALAPAGGECPGAERAAERDRCAAGGGGRGRHLAADGGGPAAGRTEDRERSLVAHVGRAVGRSGPVGAGRRQGRASSPDPAGSGSADRAFAGVHGLSPDDDLSGPC